MQFLNRDFYNNNNILGYINSSMQTLINMNSTILGTKEYMLFFYIKEDFSANYFSEAVKNLVSMNFRLS